MKMNELVRRTGVRKATIHFYISQGLLPKPRKTERNMAYYDETYVDRIALIKELQVRWFLPLNIIKDVISRTDGKLSPSELDVIKTGSRWLIHSEEHRRKYKPHTLNQLSLKTGLPAEDILDMERQEIISSTQGKSGTRTYRDIDIRIAEAFAAIRKVGFTKERGFDVSGFRFHSDLISMLAVEEVKDFARRLADRSLDDPKFLPKLAEKGMESINVYISHLHRKKFVETVQSFLESKLNGISAGKKSGKGK